MVVGDKFLYSVKMYADNTLTPKEVARLCALGTLADQADLPYSELAASIRYFIDRIQGPSLDVLGSSIELLKYEGLVLTTDKNGETCLSLSERGLRELHVLLKAQIRPGATDLNKLIISLKFRFLHLLNGNERAVQIEVLLDTVEVELARFEDLREHHADVSGYLLAWLDQEIRELSTRASWLKQVLVSQ